MEAGLSAPLSRTRSKLRRSRQMMSKVMWSTPAFLLRMVVASSTSFMGVLPCIAIVALQPPTVSKRVRNSSWASRTSSAWLSVHS